MADIDCNRLEKKIETYLEFTERALEKIKINGGEGTHLKMAADDILEMVEAYLSDARHFKKEENLIDAFAAINYAYGWLDCAVRLGILDGKKGAGKFFTI